MSSSRLTLPSLNPRTQQTGPEVMASAGQALGYVTSAAKVIFIAIAILVLAFYWTLDGPRTIQSLLLLVPQDQRESISELISAMETKVGFYIAGQGVLCLVIGIMALVAYLLIGLPNALVLALVAGVLEAVPMVGPLLGAIPAALVALSIAPDKLVWVIVAQSLSSSWKTSCWCRASCVRRWGSIRSSPCWRFLPLALCSALPARSWRFPWQPLFNSCSIALSFIQGRRRQRFRPAAIMPAGCAMKHRDLAQDLRKQARLKKGARI